MIRLPRVPLRALGVLGALTFAACSGAGSTGPPPVQGQPPGPVCPDLVGLSSAALVQPANGAVGVSTTIGSVVATSNTGLAGAEVVLKPASGAESIGGIFAVASSTTVSATVPVLAAHTTYTVSGSSVGTCPGTELWSIGSFTTQ